MYIGIDIGGTKCAVTGANKTGQGIEFTYRKEFKTSEYEVNALLSEFETYIKEIAKREDLQGIGISCGGPLDSEKGIIMSPPNLPGWDNIEIVKCFEETFKVPVRLENDANACALAEWKYGAGKGTKNMVFLTFGTGLGAGLILNGSLYTGSNGMAGEVGHIRLHDYGPSGYGKCGSFEGFCSGGGISELARTYAARARQEGKYVPFYKDNNRTVTAKEVCEYARKGDETSLEIMKICGENLGKGLAVIIDILNPQAIVIGSIFTRSYDLLWEHAERVIKKESLAQSLSVCRILPAALGESIGDYGSIAVATEI